MVLGTLATCGGSRELPVTIRLVDEFTAASVEAAAPVTDVPRTEWIFSDGIGDWKGRDVDGLAARDGKLVGRSTSTVPLIYVERTDGLESHDILHEVVIRMRVSAGANLGIDFVRDEELDLDGVLRRRRYGWELESPVIASTDMGEMQTYRISAATGFVPSYPASWIRHVIIRPTDAENAELEIESIRLVFRKEHLAAIPAGVGWQGLSDIFRETIVTRVPERAEFELTVPENAFFEVTLGTVEDGPVTFVVDVEPSGRSVENLLTQTLTTPDRWEPAYLDLSHLAGEDVTLTLSLEATEEGKIGFWGVPAIRSARPNPRAPQGVILVVVDTLRRDHLEMYGYERETAPNLTRLAAEGVRFDDAIAQGSWTKVSVPSFLSSTYPTSNGISDRPDRLPASATTLAEAFREAGYATWHSSSVPFSGRNSNLHQGVEVMHEVTSFEIPEGQSDAKIARSIADRLIPWIEAHRDVPFFAFFHAMDPHDDFEPYRPYDTLWAAPDAKAKHEARMEKLRPHIENPFLQRRGLPTLEELEKAGIDPEEFVAHEHDWYDGSIRGADVEVGRIVEKLETLGIAEDTLIVFLSDHGEEFLEHGGHFHGRHIYGELVNVPLAFHWPRGLPAGVVRDETVQLLDMAPTVLELSGLPVPETMQGQSLVPLFSSSGDVTGFRSLPAISEYVRQKAEPIGNGRVSASSIIHDGWKLVHHWDYPDGMSGPEYELFEHRNDPLDRNDVAAEHPEIVERLAEQLEAWRKYAADNELPSIEEASEEMTSEELERLRSLGYVQ